MKNNNERRTYKKIDLAIIFVLLAIIAVLAIPRYQRYTKIGTTKHLIVELEEATEAAIEELKANQEKKGKDISLSDELCLSVLKRHLQGQFPANPFTHNNDVALIRQLNITPGQVFDVRGGWIWKLVFPQEKNKPVISQIWLNSDTVHIGQGKGESYIHP